MFKAIKAAFQSYEQYKNQVRDDYLVVVDFTLPSHKKRLYVLDIKTKTILRSHHVAHGSGSNCSNKQYACKFSNKFGSRKSSLGAMKTGTVYTWGKRFPTRKKLKLHSLEKQNNNVFGRGIIIHSSNYVTDPFIARNGRAGNSWGCLAVDPAISGSLIELVRDGCLVYCYF